MSIIKSLQPDKPQGTVEDDSHTHLARFTKDWSEFQQHITKPQNIIVDGNSLTLPAVAAVATQNATSKLADDQNVIDRIEESFRFLMRATQEGVTIYGVNTGFGGSAGLRTNDTEHLQSALMQLLNVGVLGPLEKGDSSSPQPPSMKGHALPDHIVKGMMLIRCNSLMRGHSGVEMKVIEGIHALMEHNALPVVPLRGSISASGDLMPLSYIAGMLEGNPDIFVKIQTGNDHIILPADRALSHLGLEPLRLKAKSALAIANGTATSASAAALALFQGHQLAVWTQMTTVMTSEALVGSIKNFAPFISETRPHAGQKEAAANLTRFLKDSQLTTERIKIKRDLAQDRYALRTAPQWIGPILEKLQLADKQVEVELNSTTDNPLIDVEGQKIYNGGNFQATSVTSAMELTSSSMQMLGRLAFAQCSELLNNEMNPDLPPNLSSDEPSRSLPMKGLDISMSAYMAELAQLTHPVSSHIQSAEMHNQAVNSMALVASRIALDSIDVLYLMTATHIYVLCQALDLRCLLLEHLVASQPLIAEAVRRHFGAYMRAEQLELVTAEVWQAIKSRWGALSHKDLELRCTLAVCDATGQLLDILNPSTMQPGMDAASYLQALSLFRFEAAEILHSQYNNTRARFFEKPSTAEYLGASSKAIYQFVREELKIPMHKGLADHPTIKGRDGDGNALSKTIGGWTGEVYNALRQGRFFDRVMTAIQIVAP